VRSLSADKKAKIQNHHSKTRSKNILTRKGHKSHTEKYPIFIVLRETAAATMEKGFEKG
jgi:hypothetical protein